MILLVLSAAVSTPADQFMSAAYAKCMAGDDSDVRRWQCGDELIARDRAAVKRAFQQARNGIENVDAISRLDAEQRAWDAFHRVACTRFQVRLQYGSMGGTTDVFRCLHGLARDRVTQLKNPTFEISEHEQQR